MHIRVGYARQQAEFTAAEERLLALPVADAPLDEVAAAVRAALESPVTFPPLRSALTPDDRVTIVVDEQLPRLPELLTPVLDHVVGAGISPGGITLLCPPSDSQQPWLEQLPDEYEDMRLELHKPEDRRALAYLATMKKGRRLYLNRSLVDADQAIILSGRRFDPVLGHGGAEAAIFPTLSDAETRGEYARLLTANIAPGVAARARDEAQEAAWLLGVPFFVQAIEAGGDEIAAVVAGSVDASAAAARAQDQLWLKNLPAPADLVVATVRGDPTRHTFADLASALSQAARAVRPDGRIILLSGADPELTDGADTLREAADPDEAFNLLRKQPTPERLAALLWAQAARHARIYLLSGLAAETVEELFATPLQQVGQAQRLLDAGGICLFLEDAHKSRVVIKD